MGDVLEYLNDGISGISPGDVSGSVMVAGVCSLGTPGKAYLLGRSSDLPALLGSGPLVDRLRDMFSTAGQDSTVIAVPVAGLPGGYFSTLRHTGTGPDGTVTGSQSQNADVIVEIVVGGALGTATYKLSTNGGTTFGTTTPTVANGQIAIATTGATLTLNAGTHVAGDRYMFAVRTPIGPVTKTGTGPDITAAGTPKAGADVVLTIVSGGALNAATYTLSLDGGDSTSQVQTVPLSGLIPCGDTGVTITATGTQVAGTVYAFSVLEPVPSISGVMAAIDQPLSRFDVESVYIVGPSDTADWASMGAKADSLWAVHRPVYFRAETRLPYADEDLNAWTAAMLKKRQGFSHRFVIVCSAFGEVSDYTGKRITRNWAGLLAGRVLSIPVMRAAGRVRDGGISQGSLPSGFTEAMQKQLEAAGFVTAKYYAGLEAPYWGDSRTMADVTSDYRYEEVLRVVFKAVRLARIAALKALYDEAGDPVREGGASGLNYLKASIETALGTMTASVPQEMAAYQVMIPTGQDIVNNGVAVEMILIGIPIIRTIKLYAGYTYAGGAFDPRLRQEG